MKLHLPPALRAALLAVTAVCSHTYANDMLFADDGNIPVNDNQGARRWYNWATILNQLRAAADKSGGTITGNVSFTLDGSNSAPVDRELDADWVFDGNVKIDLTLGTLKHYGSYLGSGSNVEISVSNGATYSVLERNPEVYSSVWIGKGASSAVSIALTGGGKFVMNHLNGIIADNGAHADITVGSGSTFTLVNGTIARNNKSYANITVGSGGIFAMSGGKIGAASGATNTITVANRGVFALSGGYVGYDGMVDMSVENGGALMMSGGAFAGSNSSILKLAGSGSGNIPTTAAPYQANAALFISGTAANTLAIAVQLTGDTTINAFDPGSTATFTKAFDFGRHTLTKLGQGNITFGSGFAASNVGAINLDRGTLTLDYALADTLDGLALNIGSGNANDASFGLIIGSRRYTINHIADRSSTHAATATIAGSGTLVIDYSGDAEASTTAAVTGGGVSLVKQGSGTQEISGRIDAAGVTVTEGTLRLGSAEHEIALAGEAEVLGALHLNGNATVNSLAGSGTLCAAGSLTVREGGSTSLTFAMANGATLAVQSGDFSASALSFEGSGTLTVSLTGGVHLDFGDISATSITLTLSDAEISSLGADTYTLFSNWKDEWSSIFHFASTRVGRSELSFSNGAFTLTAQNGLLTREGGNFTWDNSGSAADWTFSGGTDRFYNGDSVSFGGSGGTASISGDVVANEMEVAAGTWNFVGSAGSLQVVSGLSVGAGATANFTHPSVSIGGDVTNSGALVFSGARLTLRHGLSGSGDLTISSASAVINGLTDLRGGTATFSGSSLALNGGLSISGGTASFTGASVSIADSLSITGGEVAFSGTDTTIAGSAYIADSTVSFTGTNLNATNKLSIGNNGTAIIRMTGADDATAANSPMLGTPATGRALGNVAVAEGGRLVVYGYNGNTDTSYTWKQNTTLTTYTSVVGGGTLEFCDLGYQVLSGEAISAVGDQYGNTSRGSSILFRFISVKSTETNPEKIHIVELSTQDKAHATSLAFDRGDPANGWNPATALLKRIDEIHVKTGAALGFTARNFRDEGIQSGAKVFETTHGVLHLAGDGTGGSKIEQGSNAALYVTTEGPAINVSMPWDVVLDANATVNPYNTSTGITFTGQYNGNGHNLNKVGSGTLTFGAEFTTAAESSGTITAGRGNLVFAYTTSDALKDYDIVVKRFNTNEQATLTLQGGSYAVRQLSGTGIVTGSGTLEFTLREGSATFSSDIVATATNERISLKMSGSGEQIISGSAALNDVSVNAGTLTLGTATMDTLSGGGGGTLNATGSLTIGRVSAGTSLAALAIADGARLQIGGGTLAGGTLTLGSNSTLAVSLEGGTLLDLDSIVAKGKVTLELLDLYLPAGISPDTPYRLFANWKEEYQGHISMGEAKLGRSTVVFDDTEGTITILGNDRADLVWDGSGTEWQATTALTNWDNQGAADSFYNGDNVTFDTVGSHSVTISGTVIAGNMTVQQGDITLRNSAGDAFSVSGTLTVAAGAALTLDTATTALRGEVRVGSGATLTLAGASTTAEDTITISGGKLLIHSTAAAISGDIVAEDAELSITGAFTATGSITLGQDGKDARMTIRSSGSVALGQVVIHSGSTLLLDGGTYDTAATAISGAGTLELANFGAIAADAAGGMPGSMLGGNIGALKASGNTLINFTAAGAALTNTLNRISEIHITPGSAIGFSADGVNAMVGSTGTLHLAGAGSNSSNNAALFVWGSNVNARLTWDVALEGNTTINTVASQANITLTGTLNANGHTITKNGQGHIITGADFNTVRNGKGGTLLIARSGLTLGHINNPDALKDYTLQLGYFNGTGPNCTLTLLEGGTYAIGSIAAYSSAAADKRSIITGNGTIELWSAGAATVYADVTASEGGRVSLAMKGSGVQTISGGIVAENITVDAGTLVLGGAGESGITAAGTVALNAGELSLKSAATLATLSTGAGKLTASGSLSIERAEAGTAASYGNISVGGDLTLGGGTLKGGTLTLNGTLTVSLADEAHLDFDSIVTSGIRLELTDAVIPAGYGKGKSYRLFENWNAAAMAGMVDFADMTVGRLTAVFNDQTGAIDFDGEAGELTWLTDGTSNVWHEADDTALNWNHDGKADYFIAGDHVTFDDEVGEAIALHGSIFSGNVTVKNGSWTFADDADAENELTIGGSLTIESGASLSLANAASTLTGGTVCGALTVAAAGGFVNSGTLTIENGGSMRLVSGAGSSAKTIGNVTVNKGGALVIEGRETVYGNNYAGYLAKNTAEQTLTSVSGEGAVELSGVYNYVWSAYNVLILGDDGGILASLFPVADSEVSKGKIGALKLTDRTALSIQTSSGAMKNILSHIGEIHVAADSSLGFAQGSSDLLSGTTGTFHLAGSGTGRGALDNSGKYGALFVSGDIMVNIPWNITIDPAGATLYTAPPSDRGQRNIMRLTGALTLDGAKLTILGNEGIVELAEGFTTQAAAGRAQDSGTIIIGSQNTSSTSLGGGTLVLNFTGENALASYVIALNPTGNLTVYDTSSGAESYRYRVRGLSDDVAGSASAQSKRATVMGYGTLIIDTGAESYTSQAGVGGGMPDSSPTLTLVKEGSGEQKILGEIIALSATVKEGTLTLGSSGNTVQVKDALTVDDKATLSIGGNLTVGTLTGAGKVAAQDALTLAGDLAAFSGTLDATARGAQWKLTGAPAAATTLAAKLSGDIAVAYASAHDVTLSGGAAAGSTLANAMTGTDEAAPGALVLEGVYANTTLDFHSTEIRLGSATAAAEWSGALSGSGTFTLVNGTLGAALTSASAGSVALAVDAAGAVNVNGTAGALLSSIGIREGGSLSGVSGNIDTATTDVSLVLGTGNLGSGGTGLISSTGDLRISDTAAFSIGFSAEAFAELLKADGKDIRLQVLNGGGSISLAPDTQLSDILKSNYGQLLTSYKLVKAAGGSLIVCGSAENIYLVLADGSRDAATIRDYTALDGRIATVVDEFTTLTIEPGDSSERQNTITVNNLVGLKGSVLHIAKTGSNDLTLVLNNSDNGLDSSAGLPDGLGPKDVRGIDTEFKGTIVADNGVSLRKIGTGTLYVGEGANVSPASARRSADERGGMQVEDTLSICEGAIVLRGESGKIGALSFDYAAPAADGESRGFTADGSCVTIHSIAEGGSYTEDNTIALANAGKVLLDGEAELNRTSIVSGAGGGTLGIAESGRLTLADAAGIAGADVQVDGGSLILTDGASAASGNISVVHGGEVQVGSGSGIFGGSVDVQSGSLALASDAAGIITEGALSIAREGTVDLAGSSASVGALSGSGALMADKGRLCITGSGSEFSGTLGGRGGSLVVAQGASMTLKDAETFSDAAWDACVQSGGALTVDIEADSRATHLGTVTLEDHASFTYKYDTGRSSNFSARLKLADGAQASFTIYSDGAVVDANQDLMLNGLTFSGNSNDLDVLLKGKAFVRYTGKAHLREDEDGMVLELERALSNAFLSPGMHKNARAGAEIFWAAFDTQGAAWQHMQQHPQGDLAAITDDIYARNETGADKDRLMAAGAGASLAVLSGALQDDLHHRLRAVRNRAQAAASVPADDTTVWVSADGAFHKLKADGLAPGYTLNGWGGSVGADMSADNDTRIGLSLSAMYNDLKVSGPDTLRGDMDTWYVCAYGQMTSGAWVHTLVLTGGKADLSLNRTVHADSRSYTAHGSSEGSALGAAYELAYRVELDDEGSVLQPVMHAQVRRVSIDSFAETGSDAGLHADGMAQTIVTLGIGARLTTTGGTEAVNASVSTELHALVKVDLGDHRSTARTGLIHGGPSAEVEAASGGAAGVELGAGVELPLGEGAGTLFAEAAAELRAHYSHVSGTVGYRIRF